MLRNLILTLAGGLAFVAPLTAQECSGCKSSCDSATVATTVSQDEPSAVAKGLASLAKKPFKFDFNVNLKDGENAGTVGGSVAFGDNKHFAMNMKFAMTQFGESVNGKVRLVADGTWLYYHLDAPEVPAEFALGKVQLSAFNELVGMGMAQSPLPVLDDKGNLNAGSIDQALSMAGIKIARDAENGIVNLSMTAPEGEEGSMNMVLDGKSYLPRSMKMVQGESETVEVKFSNASLLKDLAAFGEKAWAFEVPEGTIINDMTAMLNMAKMQMAPAAGGEEELEF